MPESAVKTPLVSGPDYTELFEGLAAEFLSGKTLDLAWRRAQLKAVQRMMRDSEADLFAALKSDLGKSAQEAFVTETSYVSADAAYSGRKLNRWTRRRRVSTPIIGQPGRSWVQPEPLGTVLVIGAWNYPVQLTLSGMSAAIAAGNCVVIKPSELAPATSALLAKLVPQYLDDDCVKVIEGAVTETTALLDLPFDHILYTGGGTVGRIVMAAAAKHLTPVTLELGGKSPCVVLSDADLEATAKRIAWGKFTNAGQTCIAPDYILADADTEALLLPLLEKSIREMFGDDPQKSDSYGRMINERHFERVSAFIDCGYTVIGGQTDAAEKYIAPTVLTDVKPGSAIMKEEIFGPVLPIVRAENLEDAIAQIRGGDKPLAAYLFTSNKRAERKFLEQVSCGSACVNDVMMFMAVHDLPFGGVGASGMGAYSGQRGFETFSHMKAVMKRGWWPDLELRYAPHSEKKLKILRKLR
ncbi:MAG: aldehyde dehydrogenase family protein [Gammaproteobacteria bacterium]|nr:aldehyde dehydrogenase family protein [Gammaproteobacteria bacterium]MDH5240616.1 aldehyde dehydrogenase family protein [Gammaproteobacteria bacterium]MDH5261646.1 aldehyde dehydrogenase family protein [Gammaproteobacteria bacterium]MDH5583734.1 aldehyde dehydrogenase family protein [Gammaproteobacteria bacterium]